MTVKIGLGAIIAVLCMTSSAQIYRWVDKDGKVHFSDKKPEDAQVEEINANAPPPAAEPDVGELRRRAYLRSAEKTPPETGRQSRTTPTGHPDQNAAACTRARVEYGILTESVAAYYSDSGELRAHWSNDTYRGTRQYIDDAQRPAELQAAAARINRFCQDPGNSDAMVSAWNAYVDTVYCDEARVKLERSRQPRTRTPKDELRRLESEFSANCTR